MDMKTTLTVSDDGILTFPDDIMEELGWKEGDLLQWIDNNDGSFSLVKHDETL
jgi:bifunctional DNA-binding transcriptional regulator/antitoxin component of YhaV-PrlF toxin-antitoxin module